MLCGCQPKIIGQIQRYHATEALFYNQSYFVNDKGTSKQYLEEQELASELRKRFESFGLQEIQNKKHADLILNINIYKKTNSISNNQYAEDFYKPSRNLTTLFTPNTEGQTRKVQISLKDPKSHKNLFESELNIRGKFNSSTELNYCIANIILDQFPGINGEIEYIKIPYKNCFVTPYYQ